MFNQQPAKMAPTDNVPAFNQPEANNLLSFVSSATVNIHEALGKHSKKRTVNIKKYAQKRVKRLEQGSSRRSAASTSQTKSKSAQLSPPSAKKPVSTARAHSSLMMIGSSSSWPELPLPPNQPPLVPQTTGVATTNYPTYSSHPPMQHSYSDPSLHPPTSGAAIDDDLAILLLELDEAPTQQSVSSRHTSGSVTPCFTPQPTLESQVALAEHPLSPYSDCGSDELYDIEDSAYSSPISYNCSPAPMATVPSCTVSSTGWTSLVPSPPTVMAQGSIACGTPCSWMEMPTTIHGDPLTSGCSWIPDSLPLTVSAPISSVIDQGPPATPTVIQFLSEWGSFQ